MWTDNQGFPASERITVKDKVQSEQEQPHQEKKQLIYRKETS